MGREKEQQLQAEENWRRLAESNRYYCEECGCLIEYDDREIYFATKHCGGCNHYLNKDD